MLSVYGSSPVEQPALQIRKWLDFTTLGLQNFRNHDFAKGVELRLIAKEAGFPDSDLIEQAHHFRFTSCSREAIQVVTDADQTEVLHSPAASIFEKPQLAVGMKNASLLIDEIANSK